MVRLLLNVVTKDGKEEHVLTGTKWFHRYRPEKGFVKYKGDIYRIDPHYFYRDTWRVWSPFPFICLKRPVLSIDFAEGDGDPKQPKDPLYKFPDGESVLPKNSSSGWAIWSEDQSMTRIWSGQKIDAMAIIAIMLVFAVIILAAPNIGKLFGR